MDDDAARIIQSQQKQIENLRAVLREIRDAIDNYGMSLDTHEHTTHEFVTKIDTALAG